MINQFTCLFKKECNNIKFFYAAHVGSSTDFHMSAVKIQCMWLVTVSWGHLANILTHAFHVLSCYKIEGFPFLVQVCNICKWIIFIFILI